MTYSLADAQTQATALLEAAKASPVRQIRYELTRRGREWSNAAEDLERVGDEDAVIELAGAVLPGMRVLGDVEQWAPVVRQLTQYGQFAIHAEDGGRPLYVNCATQSSPVVVKQ